MDPIRLLWSLNYFPHFQRATCRLYYQETLLFRKSPGGWEPAMIGAKIWQTAAHPHPNAPRVPKVYDCFYQDTITYLVMEYIQGSSPQDITVLHQQTANAIDWLLRLPAPPDAGIGPLGGGYARHSIFQDGEAPLRFSCNEALEIYLNKARPGFSTRLTFAVYR